MSEIALRQIDLGTQCPRLSPLGILVDLLLGPPHGSRVLFVSDLEVNKPLGGRAGNREKSRRIVRMPFWRLLADLVRAEHCPGEMAAADLSETARPSADRLMLLRRFAAGPNKLLPEDNMPARSAAASLINSCKGSIAAAALPLRILSSANSSTAGSSFGSSLIASLSRFSALSMAFRAFVSLAFLAESK